MKTERVFLTEDKRVYFDAFLYEEGEEMEHLKRRPAVVVCPGGGYNFLCPREGDPIAMEYTAAGYNTFVLHYSVGEFAEFPTPLIELSKTVKMIRDRADEWGIIPDKIAVMGFSAGGHLAASLGVHNALSEVLKATGCKEGENRPNAMILIYPVISTSWMQNNQSGKVYEHIMGSNDYEKTYKLLNLQANVTEKTPTAFLAHTVRDKSVPVFDSINFASRLIENSVPCELHIFPNGGHGLSAANKMTVNNGNGADASFAQWVDLSKKWLDRLFNNESEAKAKLERAAYSTTMK